MYSSQIIKFGILAAKKRKLDLSDLPHLPFINRGENAVLPLRDGVFVPPSTNAATSYDATANNCAFRDDQDTQALGYSNLGSWELMRILWQGKLGLVLRSKKPIAFHP